jgi:hypothetical protein
MSKIGFKRLSRGVKLLTTHIHSQVQSALTRITSTGFDSSEMENNAGKFRVNISLSNITPKTFFQTVDGTKIMKTCAGFTLPPPQESFSPTAMVTPTTPVYILESIGLSFDSQATPFATVRSNGSLSKDEADKVKFNITIQRKPVDVFGGAPITAATIAAVSPEMTNVTLSLDYPNILFNSEFDRDNPGVKSDLDTLFDPYSAYLLSVDCGSFAESATELRIDSLMVTLQFRTELLQRDSGSTIQNMPQSPGLPAAAQYGARYTVPETITTPAANAKIVADATGADDGVDGSLAKTDVKFLRGLIGGYTNRSRRWGPSNIKTDAAYEVISVPMWGNGWYCKGSGGGVDGDAVPLADLPFVGGAPYSNQTMDRRIIPIRFPFTVHHVIVFCNYSGKLTSIPADEAIDYSATNQWSSAASASLTHQVGVGIGTGIRGDLTSSRTVATAQWNRASIDSYRISRLEYRDPTNGKSYCQGDLLSIPLVYAAGSPGVGYGPAVNAALSDNGKPVFVGQTNSTDVARSPMASAPNGANTALAQDGYEQFLDIRWGIDLAAGAGGLAGMDNSEVIIGQGGFQVYIIGKKHLC